MKAQMLEQFQFTDELKERLVLLVVFQNQSPKELAKKYGLPNVHILINWVRDLQKNTRKRRCNFSADATKKTQGHSRFKTTH